MMRRLIVCGHVLIVNLGEFDLFEEQNKGYPLTVNRLQ